MNIRTCKTSGFSLHGVTFCMAVPYGNLESRETKEYSSFAQGPRVCRNDTTVFHAKTKLSRDLQWDYAGAFTERTYAPFSGWTPFTYLEPTRGWIGEFSCDLCSYGTVPGDFYRVRIDATSSIVGNPGGFFTGSLVIRTRVNRHYSGKDFPEQDSWSTYYPNYRMSGGIIGLSTAYKAVNTSRVSFTTASASFKSEKSAIACHQFMQSCAPDGYDLLKLRAAALSNAVDGCKAVSNNMIAYVVDLPSFGKEIPDILATIANPQSVKQVASAYLGYQYGSRLTVSETRQLLDTLGIKRNPVFPDGTAVSRGRATATCSGHFGTTMQVTACCKLYYSQYSDPIIRAIQKIRDYGWWLGMKNAWDLVPLSFVVDWFVDISTIFEDIDRRQYYDLLNVHGALESIKYTLQASDVPHVKGEWSGSQTSYSRFWSDPKDLSLKLSPITFGSGWRDNVLQGAALLITTTRR